MSVQVAPPKPRTPPASSEERVHTGLFWLAIIAVVSGALMLGASRVWAAQAPKMVTFPLFDQAAEMRGTVTLHVEPATLATLQPPTSLVYDDVRRTQTPSLLHDSAVVLTSDSVTLGSGSKAVLASQYLVDIRTLHNLASPLAWSFAGTNVADRSSAYSVNLPFDTGSGPYAVWLNEAGRAYTFTQAGQPFEKDGVTVIRLRGHLDAATVDPLFIAQMSRAGLPAGVALQHVQQFTIPPGLTPADIATLTEPIPLDYSVSADTSLLVEPRAGTIVAVEAMDETFTAHLDAARTGAVTAVLDRNRGAPGAASARDAITRLSRAPETHVFDLHYAQTAASVKKLSAWAGAQRDWINRMTRVIPTTLFAGGILLMGLGLLAGLVAWKRRNTLYEYWWEEG